MSEERWTIGRLLTWTADYFRRHGADSPRLDAEVLLAHVLECPRIALYTHYDREPTPAQRQAFRELVQARAAGKPVAYLVQSREFFSRPFLVRPGCLIPRPETEFVVLAALDRIPETPGTPWRVADLGTGSGALAVTLALERPHLRIVATDISEEALVIARENAARHGVLDRLTFLCGDWFEPLADQAPFDLIVCNPPYVSEAEAETLPVDVRAYEPQIALVGGPSGAEPSRKLIAEAPQALRPGGWLILETSPTIAPDLQAFWEAHPAYDKVEVKKDLARHVRVLAARTLPRPEPPDSNPAPKVQ